METMKEISQGFELRQRAERKLYIATGSVEAASKMTREKMKNLIHKLQVHQIELKLQNDELHRVQDELGKTRDRYAHLYDFAPIGYFTLSRKGFIDEANLTIAAMLGVDRAALIGKPFTRFVSRNDQNIFYQFLRQLSETAGSRSCDLRLVKNDGHVFYARLECRVITNKEDAGTQIRAAVSDITDRKRAEEALWKKREELARANLRLAEDNFRHSLDEFPMGVRIATIGGETIYANRALLGIYGYNSLDELEKTPLNECYIRESFAELQVRTQKGPRGDYTENEYEISIIRKDGEVRRLKIFRKEVLWNNERQFQAIYDDVTDLRRVEEALARSEERYRLITEGLTDYFYTCIVQDGKAVETIHGPRCEAVTGYRAEEFGADPWLWIKMIVPDDRDLVNESIKMILSTGHAQPIEHRLTRKDGEVRWVRHTPILHLDAQARLVSYDGVIKDITERKWAEDELLKYRDHLEDLVNERTVKLAQSNQLLQVEMAVRKQAEERIQASLKEKEVLLSEVHQRVKNNMQVIISLLRLQSRKIEDNRYAGMFKDAADRIKSMALIHETLYRTKDFGNINFKEYVISIANYLLRIYAAAARKIKLSINIEDIPIAFAKAVPCGLIINELISNSLKYAFPKDEEGEITIVLRAINSDEVELMVSDDGTGMSKEIHIGKTKTLGLELVQILAEDQLEGTLALDREEGTSFKIRFKNE